MIVPDDVDVEVDAHAFMGTIELFGDEAEGAFGFDAAAETNTDSADDALLKLDINIGAGEVIVREAA